jgi:DNA polymerase-3 subunit epsilon
VALLDLFRRRPAKPTGLPQPAPCDFIAIDFETANETRGSACSVGVTQVRDGRVVAEGLTLINPETYFNPYCSAVNGITESDVLGAPTLPDLWATLSALLEGQLVVAHNASFDMSVLRNTAARYQLSGGPGFDVLFTYRMARATWPDFPSYSLGYIAPALGITFEHHQAGDDARACAFIALAICRTLGVPGLHEAVAAHGFWPGRLTPESYIPFREFRSLTTVDGRDDVDSDHPLFGKSICFTGTVLFRLDALCDSSPLPSPMPRPVTSNCSKNCSTGSFVTATLSASTVVSLCGFRSEIGVGPDGFEPSTRRL